MRQLWGIDLGGTKIEGVVLSDSSTLEVLNRTRIATEADKGYEHIISQIVKLVNILGESTGSRPEILGIGTPGSLDPQTGKLKNSNTVCLNGQPLKRDLEVALGIPVKIANDANCFALAEATYGVVAEASPEVNVIFGVIMGTGVGGGIVVNKTVLNGKHGIAGEWGHNFLDLSGGDCYCGKIGCVEKIIAGPALEKYYRDMGGAPLSLKDIVNNHSKGIDKMADATIQRLLHFFGKAISNVINILDPDVIVIGGGVGNIDSLYNEGIEEVRKHVFNPRLETLILKPKLGDSAGVFGAANLIK